MNKHSPSSPAQNPAVGHFRKKATSFDALYDEDSWLSRRLRPGLLRRRDLAVQTVRSYGAPRVLDIGCGSGRVAEHVLEAGAVEYVGIDFAPEMLDLSTARLARFGDRVTLLERDFLDLTIDSPFDVVLSLGLFDYVAEPESFARLIGFACTGSAVASFPAWHWLKGPIRKLRYEILNDCPIYDYTEPQIRSLLHDAGFARIQVHAPGRAGFIVRADR